MQRDHQTAEPGEGQVAYLCAKEVKLAQGLSKAPKNGKLLRGWPFWSKMPLPKGTPSTVRSFLVSAPEKIVDKDKTPKKEESDESLVLLSKKLVTCLRKTAKPV